MPFVRTPSLSTLRIFLTPPFISQFKAGRPNSFSLVLQGKSVVDVHFEREGNLNFEIFKKGGPEKNLGPEKRKEEDYQKERGNPTFQVEFRERK